MQSIWQPHRNPTACPRRMWGPPPGRWVQSVQQLNILQQYQYHKKNSKQHQIHLGPAPQPTQKEGSTTTTTCTTQQPYTARPTKDSNPPPPPPPPWHQGTYTMMMVMMMTVAIDILKKRFGWTKCIIFSNIEELLNIYVLKEPRVSVLWDLNDKLQAHVHSLEVLGITGEQYGVLLCPVILFHLPLDLRLEWARESDNHEGDSEWLLEFLQNEISRREWSQSVIKQESHSAVLGNEIKGGPRQATTAALPSLSSVPESCTLCSRGCHTVNKCYDLTKVPVSEREAVLKSHNLCFRTQRT